MALARRRPTSRARTRSATLPYIPIINPPGPPDVNTSTKWGSLRASDLSQANRVSMAAIAPQGMLEVSWKTLQPNGPYTAFNATEANTVATRFANMKTAGMKIILGPGTHFEPDWLFSTYGNDVMFRNSSGTWIKGDGGNVVSSARMRDLHTDFYTRLNAIIPFAELDGFRVSSGGRPELMYPQSLDDGSAGTDWWLFDDHFTTGSGLAEGQVIRPFPQVVPSSSARPVEERRGFVYHGIDSLARTADWIMDQADTLGFKGTFHLLMPGSGARPSQVESDINTTVPRSSITARGVAWQRIAMNLKVSVTRPRSRMMLWCSSLGQLNDSNYRPLAADKNTPILSTDLNSFPSARWLKRVADEYGYKIGGENPGRDYVTPSGNTTTTYLDDYDAPNGGLMDRVMEIVVNPQVGSTPRAGSFHEFHWAHASNLANNQTLFNAYGQKISAAG